MVVTVMFPALVTLWVVLIGLGPWRQGTLARSGDRVCPGLEACKRTLSTQMSDWIRADRKTASFPGTIGSTPRDFGQESYVCGPACVTGRVIC
jgi:hypothetical protein